MKKVLTPEKTVAYCTIVLSELALSPINENSIISSDYILFDFAGVSMPPVQVDGVLSDDQLALIYGLRLQNRNSIMFRFAKIYQHYRRKISKCLRSKKLEAKHYAWMRDPINTDVDVKFSPFATAEDRLFKWALSASDKAVPGISGKSYTEYLQSVYARLA